MYDAADLQVRYDDYERQIARVNETGWQMNRPTTDKGLRVIVAEALIVLAARLSPSIKQVRTA
jgi:hypothetical protein